MVEAEVRLCEMFEASPNRMNCNATSSSEMQLAMVGSSVGRISKPCARGSMPVDEGKLGCR